MNIRDNHETDEEIAKGIFCRSLTELRRANGYTQMQIAEKLGLPNSTYANWEQGRTEPSVYDIFRILSVCDASTYDLFDISVFELRRNK